MDYRVLSLSLSLILFLSLWFLVSLRGDKSFSKRLYSLHILGVIGWTFGLIMFYRSEVGHVALFWSKFLYFSGIFIATTFVHFSYVFRPTKAVISLKKLLVIYSPALILFLLLFFTSLILEGVEITRDQNYFIYGSGHIVWDVVFFGTFLFAFIRFNEIYKTSVGIQKLRTKYILFGTYLALALAGITNVIMPWFDQNYIWLGPCFAIFWVSIIAYLIIRYRVLNINIMIKRGGVALFVFGVISIPYAFYIYLINKNISSELLSSILILAFALVIIAVLFKLKIRSNITFDQFLSKGPYQYRDTLNKLSEELVSKLDLQELLDKAVHVLSQALVVNKVEIYIYLDKKLILKSSSETDLPAKELEYKAISPIFPEGQILFKDEAVRNKSLASLFELLNADVVIPIIYKNQLLGICVLGQSQMDYIYSNEDVSAFKTFSNQIAVAIQNALSFELIQKLNAELEHKVEERTKELREAQGQLVHSAKLASVGEMAAGIAHELNNALNASINSTENLRESLAEVYQNPKQLEALEGEIQRASEIVSNGMERARNVISNLLTFTKKNAEGFQFCDIHKGLDSSINMAVSKTKGRIRVHREFCEVGDVFCDLQQLNQVFLNLINNAADAIHGKGDIWVKTWVEGDHFFISIKDNGTGIADKDLDKVFDPFFTTKPVGKGTGLGLSVSYNIVRHHEGKISVNSTEGKGTEFVIELPIGSKKENEKRRSA